MTDYRKQATPSLLLLAAVAAVWAIAGCGGDDGSASAGRVPDRGYTVQASTTVGPAIPQLSNAQFLAYINKVCRRAWVTIRQNWDSYSRTQSPEIRGAARFADAVRESLLPGIDFLIFDDIHMLGSPRGDEETIERIIGSLQASVELGQLSHWQAHSVVEIPPHFGEYNQGARRYGLDDCLVNKAHLQAIEKS